MAWLKQAVAAGYNTADVKQDKDLAALRDRADFTKLRAVLPSRTPDKKPSLGHHRQEAVRD